jgi:hypothetical protein
MDNIVLDVAIGLVFIYLLYSLLATTINEFVAMIFAYRHRMLEKAIEQMLDGKNYSYYWWDKIANGFLWMFQIKKQKNTSKHIQNILKNDDSPNPLPVDKKDFFRPCYINANRQEQKAYIKRRKLNKKASLFAANITNHPLYRRKSEQSLLYKKPAYLTASAFSDILFDVLSNRQTEINATPVLMNDIKTFVSNQLQNNPGLKSILNMYIQQANGDVQKFKLLLEDWFDDSMNRVSGWYKRQATKVLFIIGLLLAVTFNISTIDIVHKLSVNKDLRETMAKSASAYVDNANKNKTPSNLTGDIGQQPKQPEINKQPVSKDSASNNNPDTSNKLTKPPINNLNATQPDTALEQVKQQISNIKKLYNDTIAEINMMMGLGWDSSILYKNFGMMPKDDDQKDSIWKVNPDSISCFNRVLQCLSPRVVFNGYYSGLSVVRESFAHPVSLLGFLITALAITLGAPFWFDLLNKFVNIRAGGNKPSEDSDASDTSKNGTLNQKPAPNSFA